MGCAGPIGGGRTIFECAVIRGMSASGHAELGSRSLPTYFRVPRLARARCGDRRLQRECARTAPIGELRQRGLA